VDVPARFLSEESGKGFAVPSRQPLDGEGIRALEGQVSRGAFGKDHVLEPVFQMTRGLQVVDAISDLQQERFHGNGRIRNRHFGYASFPGPSVPETCTIDLLEGTGYGMKAAA